MNDIQTIEKVKDMASLKGLLAAYLERARHTQAQIDAIVIVSVQPGVTGALRAIDCMPFEACGHAGDPNAIIAFSGSACWFAGMAADLVEGK